MTARCAAGLFQLAAEIHDRVTHDVHVVERQVDLALQDVRNGNQCGGCCVRAARDRADIAQEVLGDRAALSGLRLALQLFLERGRGRVVDEPATANGAPTTATLELLTKARSVASGSGGSVTPLRPSATA